jgi:bilirubin oxidase
MKKNMTRRHFIQGLGYSTGALAFFPLVGCSRTIQHSNALRIPPLLQGTLKDGVKFYNLTAQQGTSRFLPNLNTPTWGYNGAYLGPTLRAKKGDNIQVNVTNHLNEVTTVHWHGMVLPSEMDGGPHQEIKPSETWRSKYQIKQNAATLFYHSHTHGKTGEQVYKGLGGMFILDDEESLSKGLPIDYGIDDIPVVIQDRDIASNGAFQYVGMMPERMIGKHGDTLLVNGTASPVLKAQKTLLRLRLLNASNARFYDLHFNDDRPFQIIASDGGLLEQAITVTKLPMAPAERYEILVDVSDKKQIMLQSDAGLGNAGHGPMGMMGFGKDNDFDVLLIDSTQATKSERSVPKQLSQHADWSKVSVAAERNISMEMGMGGGMGMMGGMMKGGGMGGGMMRINGQAFDMRRIDYRLKANTYEIWAIKNSSPMEHPFHIHNTQFKILSRNGQAPISHEVGYKDTVIVNKI